MIVSEVEESKPLMPDPPHTVVPAQAGTQEALRGYDRLPRVEFGDDNKSNPWRDTTITPLTRLQN